MLEFNWTAIIVVGIISITSIRVMDRLVLIAKIWLKGLDKMKEVNQSRWSA